MLRTVLWSALVPCSVTVLVPWFILRHDPHRLWSPGAWRCAGALPVSLGIALYLWSAWWFIRHGEGTPNPAEPPRHLVARGPYAWSRNPMYVACLLVLIGEEWWLASDWLARYLAGSLLVVWVLVRWWEEPQLRRRHGAPYARYCQLVPRWAGMRQHSQPTD